MCGGCCLAAFAAGGRRAMKGPADSPKVSLTGEDFRSAETWEYADDGPGERIMEGFA